MRSCSSQGGKRSKSVLNLSDLHLLVVYEKKAKTLLETPGI